MLPAGVSPITAAVLEEFLLRKFPPLPLDLDTSKMGESM
jgi:hypothetical protein